MKNLAQHINEAFVGIINEAYNASQISKGEKYIVKDGKDSQKVEILSVEKDKSGNYDVELLVDGKKDKWYMYKSENIFESLNEVNESFEHRDELAYGEVRNYKDFKNRKIAVQHLLIDEKTNKIIAAYATYNVPRYSELTGPKRTKGLNIISLDTAKNPAPYLSQQPVDYDDANSWLNKK